MFQAGKLPTTEEGQLEWLITECVRQQDAKRDAFFKMQMRMSRDEGPMDDSMHVDTASSSTQHQPGREDSSSQTHTDVSHPESRLHTKPAKRPPPVYKPPRELDRWILDPTTGIYKLKWKTPPTQPTPQLVTPEAVGRPPVQVTPPQPPGQPIEVSEEEEEITPRMTRSRTIAARIQGS